MQRFVLKDLSKLYRSFFLPSASSSASKLYARNRIGQNMSHSSISLAQEPSFGNFDLVKRHNLGFSDILVSRWRSRVSGLDVIHLDYEGMCSITNSPCDEYPPSLMQLPSSRGISLFQRKVCDAWLLVGIMNSSLAYQFSTTVDVPIRLNSERPIHIMIFDLIVDSPPVAA
jgi:hypothetical protein